MFDVIIPTYNNFNNLIKCLKAFEVQTFREFVLYVCIDGSTDNTESKLAGVKFNFEFKILTHPGNINRGRNATRNLALKYLNSKYIAMIDSDIVPLPSFLENHFNLLEEIDCVSVGNVIYSNTKENLWADYIQNKGKNRFADRAEIPAYYFTSGNAAFKSEYFKLLEGQDENMKTYGGGDSEFGYRMGKIVGVPTLFNQKAAGYSAMDKDIDYALAQMEEFGEINLKYLRKKHPAFDQLFNVNLLEAQNLKGKFIRFILNKPLSIIIRFVVNISPRKVSKMFVRYLVFYNIYKGYSRNTE